MKKFTLFSLVMLSAALAFTSCSKELDPGQVRTKEVAVSLATRLPSAPQSRAVTEQVADIEGYHLRYILEIWTSGDKPELYKRIVKEADADKTTSFDVTLLSGRTFDFLLWADYAEDGGNEDMHYTTVNGLKEVSRSEKTYITDEQHDYGLAATRDAFSAHKQVTADAPINETITLTRAVAQLNIFTTDYEQVEESFRPVYTGLTITTAADFNVLTGTSFGSATSDLRSYVAVKTEKEGTTPDKNKVFTGYYFTSSEGKNVVDMDVHFYRADNSEVVTYNMTNIPLQQNYRTNVTGALLTQTGTLHVETEAAFAGDDIETTEPKDTPTETGLYYSLDGEDWTKWETADMPEGTYSSFAALSVGGQKLTQNHLTAIKDRNLEVIDLSKAIFERNTMFNNSFENSTALRSFIFPENITYMPAYFFKGCSNLVSVGLTDAMTYIGAGGFQNCTSLTEVTLPESVTTLRTMAFRGCTNLRTVNLSNITTYERLLFDGCEHLEIQNVTFPDDMTAIPDQIFANCKSIRAVTFPPQLETIGYNAFSGCSGITEINLPQSVTSIEYGAFAGTSISSIVLPNAVTVLSPRMFKQCEQLTSATFSNDITSIGSETFRWTALESITIPGTVSTVEQVAFADMPNLKTAVIEDGEAPLTFGLGFFYQDEALTSVTFPSNTAAFNNRVLLGCYNLETITCKAMKAPAVKFEDFGMINEDHGRNYLAGLNVPDGQKKLIVPTGATGYEDDLQEDGTENYWKTVLLNPDKCGYTIEYRDL